MKIYKNRIVRSYPKWYFNCTAYEIFILVLFLLTEGNFLSCNSNKSLVKIKLLRIKFERSLKIMKFTNLQNLLNIK